MLKVSQKLEYAMRAMIELAQRRDEGGLVPAREIAERSRSRFGSWSSSWGRSHKAGLVESFRGAGGGCRLSRPPEEITVADIAEAIEGQVVPMVCLEPRDHTCFADTRCGLQGFWADVALAVQGVFRRRRWRTSRRGTGSGPTAVRAGEAVVPAQLSRDGLGRPTSREPSAASLPRIRMTLVPHTGHCPARPCGRSSA